MIYSSKRALAIWLWLSIFRVNNLVKNGTVLPVFSDKNKKMWYIEYWLFIESITKERNKLMYKKKKV